MPKTLLTTVALGLLLGSLPRAQADEAKARAIIDRALEAMGGAEKLAQVKAVSWKAKGMAYNLPPGIVPNKGKDGAAPADKPVGARYIRDVMVQWPDQFKTTVDTELGNKKMAFAVVINHNQGWMQFMKKTLVPLQGPALADQKEDLYSNWVATLIPLRDPKQFKLSTLDEIQVDGRPAVGVQVTSAGHHDIRLYFDKETGLLVRRDSHFREPRTRSNEDPDKKEGIQEAYFTNYKEIDGARLPMKFTLKRNGKVFAEEEVIDWKAVPKLDDSVFGEP
jgi:hypothetical protein